MRFYSPKGIRFTTLGVITFAAVLAGLPTFSFAQIVTIDNGISEGTLGHWSVDVTSGGESRLARLTAERAASGDIFTENVLFDYFSYVDPGIDGSGFRLFGSASVRDPANPNVVSSSGFFTGAGGNIIDWTVASSISAGEQIMTSRFTFTTRDGGPLGHLRFLQYLDEDVESVGDDVFFTKGTAAAKNLELFTMDNTEVYGVSQSGAFDETDGLENASFAGWAADQYDNMRPRITGAGQSLSLDGVIANLPEFTHSILGTVRGPRDIVSVLAWDVNSASSTATVVTSLGGLPSAASGLRPPLIPAPGSKTAVGEIDPSKPTIVLTHGLQGDNYDEVSADGVFDELWNGFSAVRGREGAGHIIEQLEESAAFFLLPGETLEDNVNIIQFVWPQAFQVEEGLIDVVPKAVAGYEAARGYADDAGTALAKHLVERLGASYNRPVHFIGHSLGTIVNAHAARLFLDVAQDVPKSQVTILDYPHRTMRAGAGGQPIPNDFFAILLQPIQEKIGLENFKIDNYYSDNSLAFGSMTQGRIYDHNVLDSPNDIGDEVFTEETGGFSFGMIDHSGVHQWYRWTMNPEGFNATNYCDNSNPDLFTPPPGGIFSDDLDPSLDPCREGWYWSLFGQRGWDAFPTAAGAPIVITTGVSLPLGLPREFGCTHEAGLVICREESSPFIIFDLEFPEGAEFLSFDYRFPNIGDGDYVSVLLDDVPIWTLSGDSAFNPNEFVNSGSVPLPENLGTEAHKLTISLFGVGEENAEFELKNIQTNNTEEHTARSLKESVKEGLESREGGNKLIDQRINLAVRHITASLAEELWIDQEHLPFPQGIRVFQEEAHAVTVMNALLNRDEKLEDERIPDRLHEKFSLSDGLKNMLGLAISDLLSADRRIAETSIEEAKARIVEDHRLQEKADNMIAKAEEAMQEVEDAASKKPAKAIILYGKAWIFSQLAIRDGEEDFEVDGFSFEDG